MCHLTHALNGFVAAHQIPDAALDYNWRGNDAAATDLRFAGFHRSLSRAVRRHHRNEIRDCVIEIVHDWGGISNYPGLADRYPDLLMDLDEDNPVDGREVTPISSWSKVLAAYRPELYNIYDTRVAVALRVLIPDFRCFLPPARGCREALIRHLGRASQLSQQDSYARYMELLHETGDALGYERKLFMLGGLLRFDEAANTITV